MSLGLVHEEANTRVLFFADDKYETVEEVQEALRNAVRTSSSSYAPLGLSVLTCDASAWQGLESSNLILGVDFTKVPHHSFPTPTPPPPQPLRFTLVVVCVSPMNTMGGIPLQADRSMPLVVRKDMPG